MEHAMRKKVATTDPFAGLSWADITDWAGSRIVDRGRDYQVEGLVEGLSRTRDGSLVAWVEGTDRYATLVSIEDGQLSSECTCPYWATCKHAVAVVLEHLHRFREGEEVPEAPDGDPRLDEVSVEDGGRSTQVFPSRGDSGEHELRNRLAGMGRAQLIDLLEGLAQRHPEVRRELKDRWSIETGDVEGMVADLLSRIDDLSSEPGWSSHWGGGSHIPDYSEVRRRLEALLEGGHADEVLRVGTRLLEAGIQQVGQSDDDGETALQVGSCMEVVFQALPVTSLSNPERMLWAVDAELADDYDICDGAEAFWDLGHSAADWSTLADALRARLEEEGDGGALDGFSRRYRRDRVTDWLVTALESAGRNDEVIPLCEAEARRNGNYVRLVMRLVDAGRSEEAVAWIREGVAATEREWPGIAAELLSILREVRAGEGAWPAVAAMRAEVFFRDPSMSSFRDLREVASRVEAWPDVRVGALHYLETGERPDDPNMPSRGLAPWPLPEPEARRTREGRPDVFPRTSALIDVAIDEGRPDDVLSLYCSWDRSRDWCSSEPYVDDKVAEAIRESHPDRAIEIWKGIAEDLIGGAKVKLYEQAERYLRKVKRLLSEQGRVDEWRTYEAWLRDEHRRKTRFLQILEGLSDRPILKGM